MTKFKLSKIIDLLAIFVFIFILLFCWVRFYTKNNLLSLFFSLITTIFLCFLLQRVLKRINKKRNLTKVDKKNISYCAIMFEFMSTKQILTYFTTTLKCNHLIERHGYFLILDKHTPTATLFYPYFLTKEVTKNDISKAFSLAKQFNCPTLILLSNKFCADALILAGKIKNLNIFLWDTQNTYYNLVKHNSLPPKVVDTSVEKLTLKQLFSYAFSKQRIKHYLLFGIILLISSFFVLYKIYYLICGTILLILCIVILLLPNKNKNVSNL